MPSNLAVEVPFVPSIGYYRFGTTLVERPYIFDVRWNSRDESWRFDVREVDETLIIAGVKIVLGAYLGRVSSHRLFKEGVFVAVDLSGQRRDATYDDLGTRVVVEYIPVLELIARLSRFA